MNLTGMYTSLERSKKLITLKSLSHVTITALRINLCDFCRGEFGTPSLFYLLKKNSLLYYMENKHTLNIMKIKKMNLGIHS
jgi:hypothetical protein